MIDPNRRVRFAGNAGLSLVEIATVLTVFSFLMMAALQAMTTTSDASQKIDAVNRVEVKCQDVLNRILTEASASVRLYSNDTEGNTLLAALSGVSTEMLADSSLPVLLEDGIIEMDSGSTDTGNCLLFLKAEEPYMLRSSNNSADVLRLDVYRVVLFYLKNRGLDSPLSRPDGLNLILFRSEPLADRGQVDQVTDPTEQRRLLLALKQDRGVRLLFDTREKVNKALAMFDEFGDIDPNPPSPYAINPALFRGRIGLFPIEHLSVATNASPKQFGVGRFTPRIMTGTGFPHGFEVRMIGTSNSRQIIAHLTVALRKRKELFYADLDSIAVSRDF